MPIRIQHQVETLPMPTRIIILTEEQSRLVERRLDSGRYQIASEVLREGLRPIETRGCEPAAGLKTLVAPRRPELSTSKRGGTGSTLRCPTGDEHDSTRRIPATTLPKGTASV